MIYHPRILFHTFADVKKFILFFILFGLFSQKVQAQQDSVHVICTDSLMQKATHHLGSRYRMGSSEGKAFDCSGYVMHVYSAFNVKLPHGSGAQAAVCDEVKKKDLQPGDLLFFSGRKISKHKIGHVAMVKSVEDDRIVMIHATVQSGVMQEVLQESEYFTRRFIKAGRLRKVKVQHCEN